MRSQTAATELPSRGLSAGTSHGAALPVYGASRRPQLGDAEPRSRYAFRHHPTITERESNARRIVALGAGAIVLPVEDANGEKQIDVAEFSATVQRVLSEPRYRAAAERIAELIQALGGVYEAANQIERLATEAS